jgi:hypothetical protein
VVAKVKADLDDAIALDALAKLVGVDRSLVQDLVNADLIKPLGDGQVADIKHRRFSRAEVSAWLEELAGDAPILQTKPDDLCSVSYACRFTSVGGLVDAVPMIQTRKIKVFGRLAGKKGLGALLVNKEMVAEAKRVEAGAELTVNQVAAELGVHPETVWACCDAGIIVLVWLDAKRCAISCAAVEEFRRSYVTATELAKLHGSKARYAVDVMDSAGVLPAISRKTNDRCRVSIYRRADVPADFAAQYARRFGANRA